MVVNLESRVGPYVGVSRDEHRPGGRFRLVLYGAYDAFGLIGPESNGIAVLDEQERQVLCDQIECETTGYFGPSARQQAKFDRLLAMSEGEFRIFVNSNGRSRYKI